MDKKIWIEPNILVLGLSDTKVKSRALIVKCDVCGKVIAEFGNEGGCFGPHECPGVSHS